MKKGKKSIRVLHLLASNSFSGAENVVCQIIKLIPEVDMIYCSPAGKIKEQLNLRGIDYLQLDKLNISKVKEAIDIYKPNIIHAHDVKTGIIASMSCKDIPIVSHMHVNDKMRMAKFSLKSVLYRMFSKKFSHIFWVSKSCFDYYKYKNSVVNKSSILYNVISLEEIKNRLLMDKNEYDYDIVFVGRLTEVKDPLRFVEIMKLVVEKNNKIKMAIVGDGDLKDRLQKYIIENKLENNIFLLGFMENPIKIVSCAKVMLMASLFEGTPMCALESLAVGVPIVSTPTDGMMDLIENGKTGWLYETNEEACEKILNIINSKNDKMKNNCLKFSKKYNNLKRYKKEILSTYKFILKDN